MTTHLYTGVTAYFKDTDETTYILRMLSHAILQLREFVEPFAEDITGQGGFPDSPDFTYLVEAYEQVTPPASHFPQNTPPEYQGVKLSRHTVKGMPIVRLHIPVIVTDGVDGDMHMQNMVELTLLPLIESQFDQNLLCIKTKSGTSVSDFQNLPDVTAVSTSRLKESGYKTNQKGA